jgi:hypothetical protein
MYAASAAAGTVIKIKFLLRTLAWERGEKYRGALLFPVCSARKKYAQPLNLSTVHICGECRCRHRI